MKQNLLKLILSFTLTILISVILAIPAFALPVDQAPYTVKQSCGTLITIRSVGDEFLSWSETLSGDIVVYNRDTSNWYYAYIEGGNIYPGNNKVKPIVPLFGSGADTITAYDLCELFEVAEYHRAQFESNLRPINLTNNRIPLLVMLIEFSDRELSDAYLTPEFSTHTTFFSNEFFGSEGKTVNTYFEKVSHNFNLQFIKPSFTVNDGFRIENPTPEVSFIEVRDGIVRARVNTPHPNPEDPRGNPDVGLNAPIRAAFNAAIEYIDLSNIPSVPTPGTSPGESISSRDFTVSVVVAGYENSASPAHLIPRMNGHVGNTGPPVAVAYGAMGELSVRTSVQGDMSYYAMGIGGAIHEIGHLFGLPDLYGHFPVRSSLGNFSVMCIGSHSSLLGHPSGTSPSLLDPWSKTQLGFIEPIVIDASEHKVIDLYSIDTGSYNVVQVISNACPDQYFLIENRRLIGFDEPRRISRTQYHGNIARGEGGILICHVDERIVRDERLGGGRRGSFDFNSNDFHRGVDLEAMMTPLGSPFAFDFNPFFVQGGLRYSINEFTTPNSNFHTPGLCNEHRRVNYDCHPQIVASNISVRVNSAAGQVMEVEFGTPCPIVAEGRLPNQVGVGGMRGAAWELCECGILTVDEGFINWTGTTSPWAIHGATINQIVFTGPITAGASLTNLFNSLRNVETIEGLGYFDTANVTAMNGMFSGMWSLTDADVSTWNTSNVTNMRAMFFGTHSLTSLDVSTWNTSNVTDMRSMFDGTHSLVNLDVSNWDTSNVTTMFCMFHDARSLTTLDVSNWDTGRVTNMGTMFAGANSLTSLDLSNWDTGRVTNMSTMFASTHSLVNLDVSNWNTANVTNMLSMFHGAHALTALDLSTWDTGRVTNMGWMFAGIIELRSLTLGETFVFRGGTSLPSPRTSTYFTGFWQNVGSGTPERPRGEHVLTSAQLVAQFNGTTMADTWVWQPANLCPIVAEGRLPNQVGVGGMIGAAWELCECGILTVGEGFINWTGTASPWAIHGATINQIVFAGPITAGASLANLFRDLRNAETIEGLGYFNTANVTAMNSMFSMMWSLTDLDVSTWNTSNVTAMNGMFSSTHSLTSLDLSNWDTSRVTNMSNMFAATHSLTDLDVSNWDTSNVTIMFAMFHNARSLTTLDVSNWDTGRVTNMGTMFAGANSLSSLDLSNWDTSRVTNMSNMFTSTHSLANLDVSNWNTANVTNMQGMFWDARALTALDLSSWDTARVTNMNSMFTGTTEMRSLTLGENFVFRVGTHLSPIRTTPDFTGYWQNVGSGTPERPRGEHVLTSAQLVAQFNGVTMADTWVWQPR